MLGGYRYAYYILVPLQCSRWLIYASFSKKFSSLPKELLLQTAIMLKMVSWCLHVMIPFPSNKRTDASADLKPSTGLGFQDSELFQTHLKKNANAIKSTIELLLKQLVAHKGDIKPEVAELEDKLRGLLAKQKEDKVRLEGLIQKKDELSASLDAAILRAVKAEKKLDRVKSVQVQKLEQQAMGQATANANHLTDDKKNGGDPGKSNGYDEGLQLKYEEAAVAEAKLKDQLDAAMSEIKTLKEENTSLKMRRDSVTDEDYARTDVFKAFKHQNEDLIKRVNDLEATNKLLRFEAEKLQAERTAFRVQLESEAQAVAAELEEQMMAKDNDLTRIRAGRDELHAELGVLKEKEKVGRSSVENMKEVIASKEDRIRSLEMELERLRPEADTTISDPEDLDSITPEDLRQRYRKVLSENRSIKQELPAIETAYKRAMTISQKKVLDQLAAEERVALAVQEKGKADQRYFAARKDADLRNNEIKTLRQQNGKSLELITALKERDAGTRSNLSNLEKQLTDLKQSNIVILEENRTSKASAAEASRRADHVKAQVAELQNLLKTKDTTAVSVKEQANIYQVEVEKLKKRIESVQKERDNWKKKSLSNISEDEEMLRVSLQCPGFDGLASVADSSTQKFASCSLCEKNLNEVVIKTCGHIFCKDCAEARIANRLRGCPNCGIRYGIHDILKIHTWSTE